MGTRSVSVSRASAPCLLYDWRLHPGADGRGLDVEAVSSGAFLRGGISCLTESLGFS